MTNDDLQFAHDRPIAMQQHDLLDRAGFAQRLALAISSWKNQESLVISLTGSWGSGKSSIKNMALEQLAAIQGSQVIEFNPWQWAGQDKLSSAFFEEISRVVQRKNPSEADQQLAKVLRRYEHRLNAGAVVLSGTAKWVPILLGSALVTTALGSVAEGTAAQVTIWTVSAVSWLGSLAPWLKQAAEWCTKRSKNLDQDAKDSELTLSQIRAELQKLLSARQKPLLIVLDDLDRLAAEQLKAMFQLVKAHMDFANVVFLLLFQRDTVEQGLQRAGFDGADYLEKIIQVPFSVPAISSGQLEAVLSGKLDAILANEQQLQQRFDKAYWDQMFQRGMRPFFGNLRHVYRYASTLAFHCRLLRGTEVAEVNAVDLFALECLRVFAPETYADMPRHKALLTNNEPFARQDEPQRTRINQVINHLVNLAPSTHQPATRQLLQEMFPTLDWVFKNTEYDRQTQLRWLINSRVCCDEVFDRYFELSVPEQDVPNSLLHELARRIVEPGAFTTLLASHEEDRQAEIIQRLFGLVDEFPLELSLAVVQTLLQAGDVVGHRMSFTNWSPRQQVVRLLQLFLLRHDDEAVRSQLVIEAFAVGPGLVVVKQLLASEYALRRKGDFGCLDDAGLERLKGAYLCNLRELAERDPEAFLANPDFESYLYDLNRYGEGGDEGRRWSDRHITSTTRFLQLAQTLVNTRSRYSGDGVTHIDEISLHSLDELLGKERCADWVARLDTGELSSDASQTLGLVKEALARHEREATVPESLSPPTISAPLF